MDTIDRALLNIIQTDFPLVSEPFAEIAAGLGITSDDVLSRLQSLKESRVIRQISAIFDSNALGYRSLLVAFSVPEGRIDEAAAVVSAHPGVSHNYERSHEYNLWFTITVPPETTPQAEVDVLVEKTKPRSARLFPTVRLFKIGVAFDMEGKTHGAASSLNAPKSESRTVAIGKEDKCAIRALQQDLPLANSPFARLAELEGMTEKNLLEAAERFIRNGTMRRYAAVLRHRQAGFTANAMTAWAIADEAAEEVGTKMAMHPMVSHCYQRPTYPDWPYSIFTMIHGRSKADCEKAIEELSESANGGQYIILYSTREFKKTRVRYFER